MYGEPNDLQNIILTNVRLLLRKSLNSAIGVGMQPLKSAIINIYKMSARLQSFYLTLLRFSTLIQPN